MNISSKLVNRSWVDVTSCASLYTWYVWMTWIYLILQLNNLHPQTIITSKKILNLSYSSLKVNTKFTFTNTSITFLEPPQPLAIVHHYDIVNNAMGATTVLPQLFDAQRSPSLSLPHHKPVKEDGPNIRKKLWEV